MSSHTTQRKDEGGNAIALTLLGLAVAILAGVVVLYFIGKSKPQPMYTPQLPSEEVIQEIADINPREGWRVYESEEYGFHIEFPQGWVVATGTLSTGDPVITISQATGTSSSNKVYGIQDEDVASHVSIYPKGVVSADISNTSKASVVVIQVPQASAVDYVLKNGKPWATKAVFENLPETWSKNGFLFARSVVEEEELVYVRGDVEIKQDEFDPQAGDRIERNGFLDSSVREIQEEILRSFSFTSLADAVTNEAPTPFAKLTSPEANTVVESPLLVRGEVFGEWYFDDDISIRLETGEGEVLAEVPVQLGEWLSEETLPFEVSLVFDTTTATSGRLLLGNQKTLTENVGEKILIPVLFAE